MTQNQLKYWELRWKQYYDMRMLEETKRSNRTREVETERHNRAQERIATQELVLKRIELSQKQEQITQKWAEIGYNERKLFIETTLENIRLGQKSHELDIRERELQHEAEALLSKNTLAIADLILEYSNETAKRQNERFSAYVDALSNGWSKAAAAKVISELEGNENTGQALKDLLKDMAEKYNLQVELRGPQTVGSSVKDWTNDTITKSKKSTEESGGIGVYTKENGEHYEDPTGKRQLVEKYGPAAKATEGLGGSVSFNENSGYNSGIVQTGPGTSQFNHERKETKSEVPGIVYSGGSQYGPGWR